MFKKLRSMFSSSEEAQKEVAEAVDSQQGSVASDGLEVASEVAAQEAIEKDALADEQKDIPQADE
ncbi:hypothetical protein, partial [Neptunomonas sp.]|uniref:hypothetical protein n=1 Tax=Neptunomonas sp. TaxID=1971898 RepID=UPI0025FF1A6F